MAPADAARQRPGSAPALGDRRQEEARQAQAPSAQGPRPGDRARPGDTPVVRERECVRSGMLRPEQLLCRESQRPRSTRPLPCLLSGGITLPEHHPALPDQCCYPDEMCDAELQPSRSHHERRPVCRTCASAAASRLRNARTGSASPSPPLACHGRAGPKDPLLTAVRR